MNIESKQQIIERRKEIEQEVEEMLKQIGSDFSLEHVRDAINNEKDNDDMQKVIAMFDDGDSMNLSNVLELVADAWNYFPHKNLNGLSPAEKLSQTQ